MAAKKSSRKPRGGWSMPIDDLGKAIQKAMVKLYGKGGAKTVARMYKSGQHVQVPTLAQRAAQKAEKAAATKAKAAKTELARSTRAAERKAKQAKQIKSVDKTVSRIEVNEKLATSEAYRSMREAGKTKRRATSVKAQKEGAKDAAKLQGGLKKNWAKQAKEQNEIRDGIKAARKSGDHKTRQRLEDKLKKHVDQYGAFRRGQ